MSKDLFLLTNNINLDIKTLNTEMSDISVKLENEKKINVELLKKLKNLKNTQNGSEILIDDSKVAYNLQYYKNWEIFIGIFILTGLIVKTYKTPVLPSK